MMMFRLITLSLVFATCLTVSAGETFKIDNTHSFVNFHVAHNTVGQAWGRFGKFEGTIERDGDQITSVNVTIDATSMDSANVKRDGHLKSPDFFNVKEFPEVSFVSTKITKSGGMFMVSGDFTMVGVTKPVTFELTEKGPVDGRGGAKVRGYHGTAKLVRSQFGMNYGSPGVGDEVTVVVSLEATNK